MPRGYVRRRKRRSGQSGYGPVWSMSLALALRLDQCLLEVPLPLPRAPTHCLAAWHVRGGWRERVGGCLCLWAPGTACSQDAGCKALPVLPSPEKVVASEALDGVPILVLANKQDVEVSPTQLLRSPCPNCKESGIHVPSRQEHHVCWVQSPRARSVPRTQDLQLLESSSSLSVTWSSHH